MSTREPGAMSLRRRLALLLGTSTAVLAIAGAILFTSLATLGTERERVVRDLDPAVLAARDLRAAMLDQETGVRGYVLTGTQHFLVPYVEGVGAEQAAMAVLEESVADDPDLAAGVEAVQRSVAAWQSEFAEPAIERASPVVVPGAADGTSAPGGLVTVEPVASDDAFQADGRVLFDDVRSTIDGVESDVNTRRDDAVAQLDRAAQRVWTVTIGALIGLIALGVVIIVALKRSVTDPIIELAEQVQTVAEGDLERTVSVEGAPELERLGSDIDAMRLQILAEVDRLHEANAAIEQQALELQRSNADLEQFAYVASHDLQEPLRKIAGFCQLLERRYKGQLDDRADEYIAFVVDGAQRMQDLINDLLAFSRVGRTTTGFGDVDLGAAADDAIANLRTAIDESGAEIEVGPLPTVSGDRRLLVALLQNLIGNAVKFRGDEAPLVRVSAEADEARGRWVLSVADNGIGIDDDYAEQIFTIFQRLHNRTDYAGTGIGLALAKKIAEYHHGAIWLDTEVKRGATFRISLPAIDAGPDTSPGAAAGAPSSADPSTQPSRPAQEATR